MTENQVFINADHIIEVQVVGDQTSASIVAMGQAVEVVLKQPATEGRPALILDDIVRIGMTDTAARQTVAKLARSLPYDKVAMLGPSGSVLLRTGTRLLLQAIGMGAKIKYFEDREVALRWLKSQP